MDEESSEIKSISGSGSSRFGDYRSLGIHGMMALGTVMGHGRRWFVKSLAPRYSDLSEARAMLAKEYDIMLSLCHEAIVRPIAFEELPGVGMSIIMDYVDGVTLSEYAATASPRQRRAVAEALVDAVAFLHRNGLTHSDLKPDNILVGGTVEHPKVTLIDFNLSDAAVYTDAKAVGGNRKYASPEQFEEGYTPSPGSDVWSLGVLLNELRPGLLWKPAVMLALRGNPERRLRDASAILMVYRRTKRVFTILLSILIVSILAISTYLLLSSRQEAAAPPSAVETPVSSPDTAAPTSQSSAADPQSILPIPESPAVMPQPASAPPSEQEDYEAQYRKLKADGIADMEKLKKEIRAFMANENLTVDELQDGWSKFYGKANEISKRFGMFEVNLPGPVRSQHPDWVRNDPSLLDPIKSMYGELTNIVNRRDELIRQQQEKEREKRKKERYEESQQRFSSPHSY